MICAARALDPAIIDAIEDGLRCSIELAFAQPERSRPWIREHAQELDDEVCRRHIELYVNPYSIALGPEGRAAIDALLARGRASGFLPPGPSCWR
jgi:1,4-dihydroxy-6-naphthoate synthase